MKLNLFNIPAHKQQGNDLNSRMRCNSYPLAGLALILFLITGCHQNSTTSIPASSITTLPAFQALNDSIEKSPEDASLYLRRATRLAQQNAHEMAYDDFHKAYTLQPDPSYAFPFASNLEILNRQTERLALLESVYKKFPSDPKAGRLLAEAYATAGRSAPALAIYNHMLRNDSTDAETMYEKAILLENMKDTAQAIVVLQQAYAYQGVITYGLELAHLYAEQKNPRALAICDYILRQDSAKVLIDPFFIKGIYYANVKQYPKAINAFDSCILRDWKTTDAYLEKGRAYFQMQNYKTAMQTFSLAITVSNTDPDAYFWLGRCYEAQHKKAEAISNYQKALSLDNHFTQARDRIENLSR